MNKNKKMLISFALIGSLSVGNAHAACGLIGCAINAIAPGLGTQLDEAHRTYKQANPEYGKAEERFTNDFREGVGLPGHCDPIYNKWGEEIGCQ